MDFFVHSRAATGAVEPDLALNEQHWTYMDRFADGMVARGPTLAADRATWTGSLHIVDLPSAEAAHEFVEREPYNRAGLFEQHVIRRFNNLLGRTMWDFPRGSDDPRFLIIAQAPAGAGLPSDVMALPRERMIVHGELLTPDEGQPAGVAFALQAPTRQALDALLQDRRADSGVEILDWEFGGRR